MSATGLVDLALRGVVVELRYKGGGSDKFWRTWATTDPTGRTCERWVWFGRVGTSGQSKRWFEGSRDLCRKHLDAAISEKLGKGYEVWNTTNVGGPAAPPSVTDPRAVPADLAECVEVAALPTNRPSGHLAAVQSRTGVPTTIAWENACLLRKCLEPSGRVFLRGELGRSWARCCAGLGDGCPRYPADPGLAKARGVDRHVAAALVSQATACRADVDALLDLVADLDTGAT